MTVTTYMTIERNKLVQRTIEFVDMEVNPAGGDDLIGRAALVFIR